MDIHTDAHAWLTGVDGTGTPWGLAVWLFLFGAGFVCPRKGQEEMLNNGAATIVQSSDSQASRDK
jgi:hypothetical protein